jgi:hypothetical protein
MCDYKRIDNTDRALIDTYVDKLCNKLEITSERDYKQYIKRMTEAMVKESTIHRLSLTDLKFTQGYTAQRFVREQRLRFSPESVNINILAHGRHLFYYLKYIYFILTTKSRFNFTTPINIVLFCHRTSFDLYEKQIQVKPQEVEVEVEYNWENPDNKFEHNFADYLNTTEFDLLSRELSYFDRFPNLHIDFLQSPNELMIGIGAKRAVINCFHYMLQEGQAGSMSYRCMTLDDNISGIYKNVTPTCTKRFATSSGKKKNYFEDMILLLDQLAGGSMNHYYYPIETDTELQQLLDHITASDIIHCIKALQMCITKNGESIHSVEYILAYLTKFKTAENAGDFDATLRIVNKNDNCYGIITPYLPQIVSSKRSKKPICPKELKVIRSSLFINLLNFIIMKRHCRAITILDLYQVCSLEEYESALMLGVDKGKGKGNQSGVGDYTPLDSVALYKLFFNNPWDLYSKNYLYNPYFTRFYEDILFNIAIPKNRSCKLGYYLRFAHIGDEDNEDQFKRDLYVAPAMPVVYPYYLWIFLHLQFFPHAITTAHDTSKKMDILTCNNLESFMQPDGVGKYARFAILPYSYYNNYDRQREFDIKTGGRKIHPPRKPNSKEGYVPLNLGAYLETEYNKIGKIAQIVPHSMQQKFALMFPNVSMAKDFNECLHEIQIKEYRK